MASYCPPGYVVLAEAILRAAKALAPERWEPNALLPGEKSIWDRLAMMRLDGQDIRQHLEVNLDMADRERDASWVGRYCDYCEARDKLRKALHLGTLVAEFINDHGKFEAIQKHGWGGDAGEIILGRGVAKLDEGLFIVTRLVLLREDRLEAFIAEPESFLDAGFKAKSTPAFGADAASDAQDIPPISVAALRKLYEDYLAENADVDTPPSREQDVWRLREIAPDKFIAKKRVYSLRNELAPPSWTRHGQRKRKPAE